jgi:hypothetical protein
MYKNHTDESPQFDDSEETKRKEALDFHRRVKLQRKALGLPDLHHYDLEQYVQVLINGATVFHVLATMQCSDRIDLVDSCDNGSNPACDALELKFKQFTKQYLGLELLTSGDPRGAVWKIPCDREIANTWEANSFYVPSSDSAYFSF